MINERNAAAVEIAMPKKVVAIAVLALAAMCAGGCPLLMVGSLGYEGYKYEKTGKLPGMPDQSSSSSSSSSSKSSSSTSDSKKASSSTPPASDIE
jgi:hypothetical protein